MTTGEQLDIFNIILDASIVVKGDLLLLIFASIASWGIILKKSGEFKKAVANNDDFYEQFTRANSLSELYDKADKLEDSPFNRLFQNGYKEFLKLREAHQGDILKLRQHYADFGLLSLQRSLNATKIKTEEALGDSLTTLASIGAISPFVGLFGTVWGIVDSFANLAKGGATLETVAPGIAEALVATAIGLVAAIPATWFYNKFIGKKSNISESMIFFSEEFVNEVERILAQKTHG